MTEFRGRTPARAPDRVVTITRYGFVIDTERCIGCHGCTVACKAEHDVPLGVNRTWVKYVERGTFPDTRRSFTVTRCNHCEDSPCTRICPVSALREREDGIVDFDPERCLGCKSCLQACPYDSLFINPRTGTSEKCNFCSHRVDRGREPACVVLCPEDAILAGDLDDPGSNVSRAVAERDVMVRKPEKGTSPKLYYVGGDEAALDPGSTERNSYLWSQTPTGLTPEGPLDAVDPDNPEDRRLRERARGYLERASRRVYDVAPTHEGSWGWQVYTYTWLKSIAAGAFAVPAALALFGTAYLSPDLLGIFALLSLVLLGASGVTLISELGNPQRFHWVLLRPNWSSWLVRGSYLIAGYGGLLGLGVLSWFLGSPLHYHPGYLAATGLFGIGAAVYSAFLFGQAKGRDLWQSPTAPVHLLTQVFVAGAGVTAMVAYGFGRGTVVEDAAAVLLAAVALNLAVLASEYLSRHATKDAAEAAAMITRGEFRVPFWVGAVGIGTALPILLLTLTRGGDMVPVAGGAAVMGILAYEYCWVTAPQKISLS